MKIINNKGTYKRKYYLHRQLKKHGFCLQLVAKNKTITVIPELADSASEINMWLNFKMGSAMEFNS